MKSFFQPTPIGTMEISPVTGEHISLRFDNASVRGVIYHVWLHARAETPDKWSIDRTHGNVGIRRPDKKINHDAPSDSARRVILDTAEEVVREWIAANPAPLIDTARERLVYACQGSGERIVELKKELAAATAQWEAAKNALWEFDKLHAPADARPLTDG
jgi:hypothetical protein